MDERYLKNVVEAALLASGRPMTIEHIRELFDERERPEADAVRAALKALEEDYEARGIELREVASGFRIQVRPSVSEHVSRLWQERPAKYSRAMLETLALIAYRQPITRSEIEDIRGVAVNPNIVRSLIERNWVRTVGHREVPGRPELLGTTKDFLDYFNLKGLEDLPTLAELRDMDNVGVQLELPGGETPAPDAGNETKAVASGENSVEMEPEIELSAPGEDGDEEERADSDDQQPPEMVAQGPDRD